MTLKHKTGPNLGKKWKQGWPDLFSSYWGCKTTFEHKNIRHLYNFTKSCLLSLQYRFEEISPTVIKMTNSKSLKVLKMISSVLKSSEYKPGQVQWNISNIFEIALL